MRLLSRPQRRLDAPFGVLVPLLLAVEPALAVTPRGGRALRPGTGTVFDPRLDLFFAANGTLHHERGDLYGFVLAWSPSSGRTRCGVVPV